MLQISKRLGLPCKTSNSMISSQNLLTKRAQRFGPVSVDVSFINLFKNNLKLYRKIKNF